MPKGEFSDRLFDLRVASQAQSSALWEGHASAHGTFQKVIDYAIYHGYIQIPGPYGIVRLDRTADEQNWPVLAFVCIVQHDMSVVVGLDTLIAPQPVKKLVTWPPK